MFKKSNQQYYTKYKLYYYSSNKYINIQVIDNVGNVIMLLSTCNKNIRNINKNNIPAAKNIGKVIRQLLTYKNIFFSKGMLKYHGKVQVCDKIIKEKI